MRLMHDADFPHPSIRGAGVIRLTFAGRRVVQASASRTGGLD